MWKEFEQFIDRGNVIEMAVGIIIGAATTSVVNSLVDDILSPIIGMFLGGIDFSGMVWTIGDAQIGYGAFLTALMNFFVIAFVLFMMIRTFNKIADTKLLDDEETGPSEVDLLTEIRDALKKK